MSWWNTFFQCVDVVLSATLLLRLVRLQLQWKYLALVVFVLADAIMSFLFVPFKIFRPFDYRYFYLGTQFVTWCTTIWMVYALMIVILQQLPGIRRFCIWFLNLVFVGWIAVSLFTVKPEWAAFAMKGNHSLEGRIIMLSQILQRAFSLAEILVILSILAFVLRFPVRVSRNLASFSAALALYLFSQISFYLLLSYAPGLRAYPMISGIPSLIMAACCIYWFRTISEAGEETEVTLGRGRHSVPNEHLVERLKALNAALLSSRE